MGLFVCKVREGKGEQMVLQEDKQVLAQTAVRGRKVTVRYAGDDHYPAHSQCARRAEE